jgi:hypothetical protein
VLVDEKSEWILSGLSMAIISDGRDERPWAISTHGLFLMKKR